MDRKETLFSYREQVNELRRKLNHLEVDSIEERALNEVRQWREKFNSSSSSAIERVLNEIEKRKQSEVIQLTNELRISLVQYRDKTLDHLSKLDASIQKIHLDGDEQQINSLQWELNSITEKIEALQMDILVKIINRSKQRRSSTALTRNTLELIKVFQFNKFEPNKTNIFEPIRKLLHRASITGANYYNTGILGQPNTI